MLIGVIGKIINKIEAKVLPVYMKAKKYFFELPFPTTPAIIEPIILNKPINAIDKAPKPSAELHTNLLYFLELLDCLFLL